MRILLIDDEEKIIELLSESLSGDGHHLSGHTNPVEALESFLKDPSKFDVIVTDHLMPSMLGTEVIERIKTEHPNFPIILATGNCTKDIQESLEKGNYSHLSILQKPYRKDTLIQQIGQLLQTT